MKRLSASDFTDELYDMAAAAEDAKASAQNKAAGEYAAAVAYKASLPLLKDRRHIQLYLAAMAQGLARNYISVGEAKAMVYVAQLALAAQF